MWLAVAVLRSSIRHSRVKGLRPLGKQVGNKSRKELKEMTKQNMWVVGFIAPLMIAILLLCAGSPNVMASNNHKTSAATAAVKIDNFVFGPQTLTVPVGTTVTWTNSDDIPHTSVSTEGVFKSKVMDTDERFSYTFTRAGTYPYYCTIHPKMTGQVVVR